MGELQRRKKGKSLAKKAGVVLLGQDSRTIRKDQEKCIGKITG